MNQAALYDLPQGWIWTRLDEIAEKIVDGSHNPPPKQTSGVPMLSAQNILNDGIDFGNARFVSEEDFEKEVKRVSIKPGDVLLTIVGTIGRSTVVTEVPKFAVQRSVAVIKAKAEPRYLSFFFRSPWMASYFLEQAKGTAQKGIYLNKLKDVPIPLAPLPEQRRIVVKMESLFAESKTARKALDKVPVLLQRFRQSVLTKAFKGELTERNPNDEPAERLLERIRQERSKGKQTRIAEKNEAELSTNLPELPETWIWTTIGELETFIGSGITPRGGKKVYVDEGVLFIRSQNVHPDGLHLENIAHVTYSMHEEMKRTHIHPNDVLLNITGASIGRSTYIPEEFGQANVNQHVCIIRTGWWIVPVYLSHFLNSPHGQDQIFATESGVTREGLNYKQVRSLRVPLAPSSEQKRVVAKIIETFSLANTIEVAAKKARGQAERIDQAVLARAFRGELVPQDPNDEPASVLLQRIKTASVQGSSD
jgi:type I restriction enzyme S subunit